MIYNKTIVDEFVQKYNIYFSQNQERILAKELECNKKLEEFVNKFDVNKMTLDEYCFEQDNKNTYCYWLDFTLSKLGDIRITGQGGFQKFHIQKINGEYVFNRKNQKNNKFGSTTNEVYNTIHKELIKLIQAAKDFDIEGVKNSLIHQTTRAKITYLYNKDYWVPIYVENDIDAILESLKISTNCSDSLTDKRVLLYGFYHEMEEQIPSFTTWRFMEFLYNSAGLRDAIWKNKNRDVPVEFTDKNKTKFHMEDNKDFVMHSHQLKTNSNISKGDTVKSLVERKMIGNLGEQIVYDYLVNNSNELKIHDIKNPGLQRRDQEHHDISYIDDSGKRIYIEVKSTSKKRWPNIYFEMSLDEYLFMKENIDSYFIYYIDDIFYTNTIHRIKGKDVIDKLSSCKYCFDGSIA